MALVTLENVQLKLLLKMVSAEKWVAARIPILPFPVRFAFSQDAIITYYHSVADQVVAGTVNVTFIDEATKAMLRTKFTLGLFESPAFHPQVIYPITHPFF